MSIKSSGAALATAVAFLVLSAPASVVQETAVYGGGAHLPEARTLVASGYRLSDLVGASLAVRTRFGGDLNGGGTIDRFVANDAGVNGIYRYVNDGSHASLQFQLLHSGLYRNFYGLVVELDQVRDDCGRPERRAGPVDRLARQEGALPDRRRRLPPPERAICRPSEVTT